MTEVGLIASVSTEPLDVPAHLAAVGGAAAGATALFAGVVRDTDHGRAVLSLEYHAHPSADAVLAEIVDEFAADPDVIGIAVSHRIGLLEIGDVAIVVAVSCGHRREAFAICARVVDEVKHRLPVWKRQVFADGTDEWVNCP